MRHTKLRPATRDEITTHLMSDEESLRVDFTSTGIVMLESVTAGWMDYGNERDYRVAPDGEMVIDH